MITVITVIGTQRNIPGIPQIEPHRPSENNMTIGLRFRRLPINRGSIKLPMENWIHVRTDATMINGPRVSNCTKVKTDGNAVAMIDPMVGMKFRKKISTAQKLAKSTPTKFNTK